MKITTDVLFPLPSTYVSTRCLGGEYASKLRGDHACRNIDENVNATFRSTYVMSRRYINDILYSNYTKFEFLYQE